MTKKNDPVPYEALSQRFDKPLDQVAQELGVCLTFLKKACREHGIKRWPFRKIRAQRIRHEGHLKFMKANPLPSDKPQPNPFLASTAVVHKKKQTTIQAPLKQTESQSSSLRSDLSASFSDESSPIIGPLPPWHHSPHHSSSDPCAHRTSEADTYALQREDSSSSMSSAEGSSDTCDDGVGAPSCSLSRPDTEAWWSVPPIRLEDATQKGKMAVDYDGIECVIQDDDLVQLLDCITDVEIDVDTL